MTQPLTSVGPDDQSPAARRAALAGAALVLVVAVVGLGWAKWWPYAERTRGLLQHPAWPGSSLLATGAEESAWRRGWEFAVAYGAAVWKALLVALVVASLVDALVPRRWLARTLSRSSAARSSLTGGLLSLPGMMCTCCTAPLTVTMRRAGVPRSAALAFWWGNPVLNPAVLGFLLVLAPWQWVVVRAGAGVLLVVAVASVLGAVADRRAARQVDPERLPRSAQPSAATLEDVSLRRLPGRVLGCLGRLALVLVPEYAVIVFAVGAVGPWLTPALSAREVGVVAVLLAALVGAALVLPTGGEIPVLLGLAAAGASAGVLGALLVVLPTVSLPSAVMVGRALGWSTTVAAVASVVLTGLLAGGALAVLT